MYNISVKYLKQGAETMTIHIIYDARSDVSNVVSVEYLNGKRKTRQIGSIKCPDRLIYSRSEALDNKDVKDLTLSLALQELLRFHDAVLNRKYRFYQKQDYDLSDDDKAKIDKEIKRLTLRWQDSLRKTAGKQIRSSVAQENIEVLKEIQKTLKNLIK